MCATEVPGGNEKTAGAEKKIFEKLMAEIVPNLTKHINLKGKKKGTNLNRINSEKNMPSHIIIKDLKTKKIEKYLESCQKETMHYLQGTNNLNSTVFLTRYNGGQKEVAQHFLKC